MQKGEEEKAGEEKGGEEEVEEEEEETPLHTLSYDDNGKVVKNWNSLDNFWKKYNKVLLDALAIEREEERLKKENSDLQEILKQYFDGISVSDEMLKKANPLFVVNGRVNLNKPLPVRKVDTKHMTIVEGNAVVAQRNVGARNR